MQRRPAHAGSVPERVGRRAGSAGKAVPQARPVKWCPPPRQAPEGSGRSLSPRRRGRGLLPGGGFCCRSVLPSSVGPSAARVSISARKYPRPRYVPHLTLTLSAPKGGEGNCTGIAMCAPRSGAPMAPRPLLIPPVIVSSPKTETPVRHLPCLGSHPTDSANRQRTTGRKCHVPPPPHQTRPHPGARRRDLRDTGNRDDQ